jgi:hypothetical protein
LKKFAIFIHLGKGNVLLDQGYYNPTHPHGSNYYLDNSSFLTITGFTRPVFQHLKSILFPEMDLPKCGRPTEDDRLGIFLVYLGSSMQTKWISMIFGACPSTVSEVIDKMLLKVVMFLNYHIHARIKFPDDQKMVEYSRLVQLRESTVHNIIGFVDGLSLHV